MLLLMMHYGFRSVVALHSFRLQLCSVKCIVWWCHSDNNNVNDDGNTDDDDNDNDDNDNDDN